MDTKPEFVLDTAVRRKYRTYKFSAFNIALPISRDIYTDDMKDLGRWPKSEYHMAQYPPCSQVSVRAYSLGVISQEENS